MLKTIESILDRVKGVISPSSLSLIVGYVVTQIPGVTSFPGLITAVKTAAADQSVNSFIDLGVQVLMAGAVVLRSKKAAVESVK